MSLALWEYFWSTADWVLSTVVPSTGRAHRPLIAADITVYTLDIRM